jgi:coenzyme F420-reducing hydrogenase beta subunit
MINIKKNKDCCGCSACVQVCPKQCISFNEDNEGFRYPLVNKDLCINCGLCEKVCPVINQSNERKPLKVLAAKNPNEDIRVKSSSGGIFTMLAEKIIEEGGVVFGAKFNDNWEVVHDFTDRIDGLYVFRGSKYVQSIIGDNYKKVESFLKEDRNVLFSGTPCQVAGLKLFLKKEYDNLLLVDFVCHGVPSPLVWRMYLKELVTSIATKNSVFTAYKPENIKIEDIQFRDKEKGWKKYSFLLKLSATQGAEKNTVFFLETLDKNMFMRGFLSDLYLRPSCYKCPSKSLKSGSDITIADYWGIENVIPEFDDDKGVSLVLINTNKGDNLLSEFNQIKIETSYNDALRGNPAIERSVLSHKKRNFFFKGIETNDIIIPTIKRITKKNKLFQLQKRIIRKVLRIMKIR